MEWLGKHIFLNDLSRNREINTENDEWITARVASLLSVRGGRNLVLEFAEMLWDETISRATTPKSVKLEYPYWIHSKSPKLEKNSRVF